MPTFGRAQQYRVRIPTATLPLISTISDAFTGTTIDTAKWSASAGVTQNNTLTVPCTNAYPALSSVARYSMVGGSVYVQVLQSAGPGTGTCETLLMLELDGSNNVRMEHVGGSIAYGSRTAGTDSMTYVNWDAALHKWWRISESSGTITFQASSTGAAWTTVGTISTPGWASSSVTVALKSGYYGTETSPQSAIFDNLSVAPTMPTTTAGSIHSGAWAPDPMANTTTWQTNLNTFDTDAGKRPDFVVFYQQWSGTPGFPTTVCDILVGRGQKPVITWEPWLYTGGATQPTYSLANIIAGNFDSYITTWAQGAKAYGRPVILRFAHEMNGDWYPWCEGVNGNTTGQYASAWQHVKAIFTAQGVTNVQWMWCPNEPYSGSTALTGLYPGSTYVDMLGIDGYATSTWWRTFDAMMAPAIDQVRALDATHDLWIAETGAVETGGSKSGWITDAFTTLKYRTEVTGFAWWNDTAGANAYSIETSGGATTAYAAGIGDARYLAAAGFTDTATGTDAVSVARASTLADVGTGADALTVAVTAAVADTGAATDTLAAAGAVPLADTGAGADAFSISSPVSLDDTVTGTDAVTVARAATLADTAAGVDALTAGSTVGLSDAATGADTFTVAASSSLSDTATAADTISATATALLADTAAGADALTAAVTPAALTDTATGADAVSVARAATLGDTATGTDALTLTATAALADTATGVDSLSTAGSSSPQLPETASATDALTAGVSVALADPRTVVDTLGVTTSTALTDTAGAADTIAAVVTPTGQADTVTGADALLVTVTPILTETASGTDALTVVVTVVLADTAATSSAIAAVAVIVTLTETGPVLDGILIYGTIGEPPAVITGPNWHPPGAARYWYPPGVTGPTHQAPAPSGPYVGSPT